MRYYKSSKRKSSVNTGKIVFRVLFVVIAAAIITGVTVLIGRRLGDKVKTVDENAVELPANTGLQAERPLDETAIYDSYSPTVFGSAVKIGDYLGETAGSEDGEKRSITDDVKTIAENYDTLTINLTDRDGRLIYPSKAMRDITRMPSEDESEAEKLIRDAVDEAKNHELRTCALVRPVLSETTISGAAVIDSSLITELYGMGFDEVLLDLTSSFGGEIDYEAANRVRTYIKECSSMTNDVCKIGVVLSDSAFLNSSNAKQIQVIANAASFIAVWFDLEKVFYTTEAYNTVSAAVTSLLGNFSVYNMRVMIDSPFTLISGAVYIACTTHGVNNVSFSSYIDPSELTYADLPTAGKRNADEDDTDDAPDENIEDTKSNPYATTKDNPSIGDEQDKNATDIPDEYSEDGEIETAPRPWY